MEPRRLLAVVLVALLAAGCAARLAEPRTAAAGANGVEVSAATGAWRGRPADLERVVTPIRVSVTNGGATPVRLGATSFALALPSGGRLAAVVPAEVRGVVAGPAPAALPQAGAALGPTRERSGPGWAINEPALDPRVDPSLDPARGWELPSPDVLALALPEGVLAPGRTARGFVYFERPPRGVAQATLTVRLVDADGEPLGVVAIPLALR